MTALDLEIPAATTNGGSSRHVCCALDVYHPH